jgi:cyclopropane fatty-acyl-phospholipid synthase-like methyltransferase
MEVLPENKNASILDIGCGFGFLIRELKKEGYSSVIGVDISDQAIAFCLKQGFNVQKSSIAKYAEESKQKFDFIVISHVLEHIKKDEIINTLKHIRVNMLQERGKLCLMVPNAQSNTGSYWAYEDFTHTTLFTSGSLLYVLKAAGYKNIKFLDQDGTENSALIFKLFKNIFLPLYRTKKRFWNKITSSTYHAQSPEIFTFDLKVLAVNDQISLQRSI